MALRNEAVAAIPGYPKVYHNWSLPASAQAGRHELTLEEIRRRKTEKSRFIRVSPVICAIAKEGETGARHEFGACASGRRRVFVEIS